ncbi:MAG: replication-relaxation family protein [Acidimicrobiales bacterium]
MGKARAFRPALRCTSTTVCIPATDAGRVLDRFQPHRPGWGAASFHYVLGPMGAAIVAAEAGDDPDRVARRWRAECSLALGRTQRLAHLVGVNGFYAALVGHAGAELADWLTEAEVAHWADGIVRPDAFGSWKPRRRRR